MRLTIRTLVRVILLAVILSAGLWLLSDNNVVSAPATSITHELAPGLVAGWVRQGNQLTDADGDVWNCDNPEATEPADMDCTLFVQPTSGKRDPNDNPYVGMTNDAGQWLIFEKRGDNELIDATGTIWFCASRIPGKTLAANGCHRRG